LQSLARLTPASATNLNACLAEYAALAKQPGIALVISDLFDAKGYQDGLKALLYRKFDVHVIQVVDHEECAWPHTGTLILRDVETGERKTMFADAALLETYRLKMKAFFADIRDFCGSYGIHCYLYDTHVAFEDFLIDYLTKGAIFR